MIPGHLSPCHSLACQCHPSSGPQSPSWRVLRHLLSSLLWGGSANPESHEGLPPPGITAPGKGRGCGPDPMGVVRPTWLLTSHVVLQVSASTSLSLPSGMREQPLSRTFEWTRSGNRCCPHTEEVLDLGSPSKGHHRRVDQGSSLPGVLFCILMTPEQAVHSHQGLCPAARH